MSADVTVVIPSIPPRTRLLARALESVAAQTHPVAHVAVEFDHVRSGHGPCRTRGLATVRTEWVAFLDDDDELDPHHIATCLAAADETGADVIVPWFRVAGGTDPISHNRALPTGPDGRLRNARGEFPQFGVTCLVRTEVAKRAEFPAGPLADLIYWRTLEERGARYRMIDAVTWTWHHDSGNTSGDPSRW